MATKKTATALDDTAQDWGALRKQEVLERKVFNAVQHLTRDVFGYYGLGMSLNTGARMAAAAEECKRSFQSEALPMHRAVANAVLAECRRIKKLGLTPAMHERSKVKRKCADGRKAAETKVTKGKVAQS
jgi:hypothetical protein